MSIALNDELRDALRQQPERPLEFEDAATRTADVLLTREQFQNCSCTTIPTSHPRK